MSDEARAEGDPQERVSLAVADGAIVGSSLKVDGHTWNPVDPNRVAELMGAVVRVRQTGR